LGWFIKALKEPNVSLREFKTCHHGNIYIPAALPILTSVKSILAARDVESE